jgi:hypothetical protein
MLVWRDDGVVTDLRRLAGLDAAVPDKDAVEPAPRAHSA